MGVLGAGFVEEMNNKRTDGRPLTLPFMRKQEGTAAESVACPHCGEKLEEADFQ